MGGAPPRTTDLFLYLHFASAFWAGEETRAKDAKDAKVKGIKDDERDKVPTRQSTCPECRSLNEYQSKSGSLGVDGLPCISIFKDLHSHSEIGCWKILVRNPFIHPKSTLS